MRASISTYEPAMSILAIMAVIPRACSGTSLTKSWLVRGSAMTLCRAAREGVVPPLPPLRRHHLVPGRSALGDFFGLHVIELEGLAANRLQLCNRCLGLQLHLFFFFFHLAASSSPSWARSTAHCRTFFSPKAFGLHDDVKGLVPRRPSAAGHAASNGVRGHDVEIREVRNHLQQGASSMFWKFSDSLSPA